jgi:hypothetical protein
MLRDGDAQGIGAVDRFEHPVSADPKHLPVHVATVERVIDEKDDWRSSLQTGRLSLGRFSVVSLPRHGRLPCEFVGAAQPALRAVLHHPVDQYPMKNTAMLALQRPSDVSPVELWRA